MLIISHMAFAKQHAHFAHTMPTSDLWVRVNNNIILPKVPMPAEQKLCIPIHLQVQQLYNEFNFVLDCRSDFFVEHF